MTESKFLTPEEVSERYRGGISVGTLRNSAHPAGCAAMRRRLRKTSRAMVSSWIGVRISRVASCRTRSSSVTNSPSIHSEAQASTKCDRSIQSCPTGELAMRSSRGVSAAVASVTPRNRLWRPSWRDHNALQSW